MPNCAQMHKASNDRPGQNLNPGPRISLLRICLPRQLASLESYKPSWSKDE